MALTCPGASPLKKLRPLPFSPVPQALVFGRYIPISPVMSPSMLNATLIRVALRPDRELCRIIIVAFSLDKLSALPVYSFLKCRFTMLEFKAFKKGVTMLTARDHINRLQAFCQLLMELAQKDEKEQLIKELRGFRADTSWLIHQLELNKCDC